MSVAPGLRNPAFRGTPHQSDLRAASDRKRFYFCSNGVSHGIIKRQRARFTQPGTTPPSCSRSGVAMMPPSSVPQLFPGFHTWNRHHQAVLPSTSPYSGVAETGRRPAGAQHRPQCPVKIFIMFLFSPRVLFRHFFLIAPPYELSVPREAYIYVLYAYLCLNTRRCSHLPSSSPSQFCPLRATSTP